MRPGLCGGGGVAFLVDDGGDSRASGVRELDGELADAARGTGDQDVAVEEGAALFEDVESGQASDGEGGSLGERYFVGEGGEGNGRDGEEFGPGGGW